jgi:hypothetical protein
MRSPLSEETKAKISATKKRKFASGEVVHSWIGRVHSEETRSRISAAKVGKKQSAAHIAAVVKSITGRRRTPETRLKQSIAATGRRHTDATKRKLSILHSGRKLSESHRSKISASSSKFHSKEHNLKVSEALKRAFREGRKTVSPKVGRGHKSTVIYNGRRIMLRSSYEFIFAVAISYLKLPILYEDTRVSYKDKTRVSDFRLDRRIYEVKGWWEADSIRDLEEAFVSQGYEWRLVGPRFIGRLSKFLKRRGYPLDEWLASIRQSQFVLDLDKLDASRLPASEMIK